MYCMCLVWKLKLGTRIVHILNLIYYQLMSLEWGVLAVLNSICTNGNNLKFVTVPWSDVQDSVRTGMVEYVREMMSSSGVSLPTRSIIGKRIKRYYRSQRHQAQIKADKEKRRRQRFLNKRNRLTMVGLYYIFNFHTQMA